MIALHRGLGQGVPEDVAACLSSSLHHEPLDDHDFEEFRAKPSARFLIREVSSALAEADARPGARPLEVVFRSGYRIRDRHYCSPGWFELKRSIWDAERKLEDYPALGAEAEPAKTPYAMLDRKYASAASILVSGYQYIDAPGGISICHDCVRIYRDFDPRLIDVGWLIFFGLYQRLIDKQRNFKRARMSAYDGPLYFPRALVSSTKISKHGFLAIVKKQIVMRP